MSERPVFAEVYAEYFPLVWRLAAHQGVPRASVEDVVQEVFMVVDRRLASFEGRSSLRTWIVGVTQNVVRDQMRKRSNRPAGEPLEGVDVPSEATGPGTKLDRKLSARMLAEVLAHMTDLQREVFVLCEIEELSAPDAAEALGSNENTVRSRLRAARQVFDEQVARLKSRQERGGGG
jgi:RNA polymerase sigma-70 factor (ECF subfamily)